MALAIGLKIMTLALALRILGLGLVYLALDLTVLALLTSLVIADVYCARRNTTELFNHHCILSIAAVPPRCPLDIVIVLDESGSIGGGNFDLVKSFLVELVGYLDVDSGNTRVGLVTYSTSLGTFFNLNVYSSISSVQSAISSLSYTGGSTDTAAALAHVRTMMLTSEAGDRPNVSNVVVLLTHGQSDNPSATQVVMHLSVAH